MNGREDEFLERAGLRILESLREILHTFREPQRITVPLALVHGVAGR